MDDSDDYGNDSDYFEREFDEGLFDKDEEEEEHKPKEIKKPVQPVVKPAPVQPSITWSSEKTTPIPSIQFTGTPGIKIPTNNMNPIDFFNLFADYDFYDLIIIQTNLSAECFISQTSTQSVKWKKLEKDHFQIFLGLLFHMGTIRATQIQDYWNTSRLFNLEVFRKHMKRDRFTSILRFLSFTPELKDGESILNDRLYKIRPLVYMFNKCMQNIQYPSRELFLNEARFFWNRNISIKLYIIKEPSGLIQAFLPYDSYKNMPIHEIGIRLLDPFLDKGHSFYSDNFGNGLYLAHYLLERNSYYTGKLKHLLSDNLNGLLNKKLKRDEMIEQYSNKGVSFMKWSEGYNVIMMVSSEYDNEMKNITGKRGKLKSKPNSFLQYDRVIKMVDHSDQLMTNYPCEHNGFNWHVKMAIHIFQMMLINSFYLYNTYSGQTTSLYKYRLSVIENLLESGMRNSTLSKVPQNSVNFINSPHFPKFTIRRPNKRKTFKRCRICSETKKRKLVDTYCPACPKEPGLCLDCFEIYHSPPKKKSKKKNKVKESKELSQTTNVQDI